MVSQGALPPGAGWKGEGKAWADATTVSARREPGGILILRPPKAAQRYGEHFKPRQGRNLDVAFSRGREGALAETNAHQHQATPPQQPSTGRQGFSIGGWAGWWHRFHRRGQCPQGEILRLSSREAFHPPSRGFFVRTTPAGSARAKAASKAARRSGGRPAVRRGSVAAAAWFARGPPPPGFGGWRRRRDGARVQRLDLPVAARGIKLKGKVIA